MPCLFFRTFTDKLLILLKFRIDIQMDKPESTVQTKAFLFGGIDTSVLTSALYCIQQTEGLSNPRG